MSKIFNVLICGYGFWAGNIAKNLLKLSDKYKVVAGADINLDNLKKFESSFPNAESNQDYKVFLNRKDIDLVFVLTPACTHFEITKDCILAGKHVFCEKPLTLNYKESLELVKLVRDKNVYVGVDNTFIFHFLTIELKSILEWKGLGEKIYHYKSVRSNWTPNIKAISAPFDLMCHDISLLLYLFGKPKSVSATGSDNLHYGFVDNVHATFVYDDFNADIENSWLSSRKIRTIEVVGSDKSIHLDYNNGQDYFFINNTEENFRITGKEPLEKELSEFYAYISNYRLSIFPAHIGVGAEIVRIIEKVEKSIKNNGEPEQI